MAAIDDLKAAVLRVQTSTSAEIKAVSDKLSALVTPDPAVAQGITDAIASLNKTSDVLDAETAALAAVDVPPPPPSGPPA